MELKDILGKMITNYRLLADESHPTTLSLELEDGLIILIQADSYTMHWYEESFESPQLDISITSNELQKL